MPPTDSTIPLSSQESQYWGTYLFWKRTLITFFFLSAAGKKTHITHLNGTCRTINFPATTGLNTGKTKPTKTKNPAKPSCPRPGAELPFKRRTKAPGQQSESSTRRHVGWWWSYRFRSSSISSTNASSHSSRVRVDCPTLIASRRLASSPLPSPSSSTIASVVVVAFS